MDISGICGLIKAGIGSSWVDSRFNSILVTFANLTLLPSDYKFLTLVYYSNSLQLKPSSLVLSNRIEINGYKLVLSVADDMKFEFNMVVNLFFV